MADLGGGYKTFLVSLLPCLIQPHSFPHSVLPRGAYLREMLSYVRLRYGLRYGGLHMTASLYRLRSCLAGWARARQELKTSPRRRCPARCWQAVWPAARAGAQRATDAAATSAAI